MLTVSGSKSQPGSGVPAAGFANKSDNFVNAPSVTFRQKSGPSTALKVTGSHSSKATTCATLGGFSSSGAAGTKLSVRAATKKLARRVFILVLLPYLRGNDADSIHAARFVTMEMFCRRLEEAALPQGFFSAEGFVGGLATPVAGRGFEGEAGWGVQK